LTETLQMSWSEVMNSFDGVYLSWDPEMWQHSLTFHGYPHFFFLRIEPTLISRLKNVET
jgi:hypothetical protein